MVASADNLIARKARKYDELIAAGMDAFAVGDHDVAHRLWREAATLDPADERAWVALLNVLDEAEDRRVCLQNIMSINPTNEGARAMLQAHQDAVKDQARLKARRREIKQSQKRAQRQARRQQQQRQQQTMVWRALVVGMLGGLLGVLGGVIASILVYGL
jgi:DNA-binding SARP family transcriptional activator